ncbi:putative manganese transporter, partial [Clostridioides difficile]
IGIIVIGFIFMLLAHSGLNLPIIEKLHSLEEAIAVIGILFSIIYMWCFKKVFKNSNQKEEENKKISLREMLIHSVGEISFVITWIFIAYLIYDLIILILGGDEYLVKLVLSTGVISVFIGAGLGLIPGCGIQIVLMSFYLKGTIPLGAVIANSISQDGDALFPLLAMDKKSSLWAMIITTIPAILVGMIVYAFLG